MDPYLEGSLWSSFHSQLAVQIARDLTPQIAPRYVALPQTHFVLDSPDEIAIATGAVVPDVGLVGGKRGRRTTATGVLEAPLQLATVMPQRVRLNWVEIRDVKRRRLVTAIEILSPTNKHSAGFEQYVEKRSKLLRTSTHLLEIDLLRRGQRVPMLKPLPRAEYFVFLARAEDRPMTEIWPVHLHEPLPTVPVPLLGEDPDAQLNLQDAFSTVYDASRYDVLIDYAEPPEIPLTREQAEWARKRVRAAGRRG